ncbi:cell division suppressor protein YneA [Bacillus xiapuensis]|uniref:cell division suppressor protein YneA n=1 Tax=Bacillus xiapuensis TaxID=2014075 RepID=UPI000C23ACF8|nr:LysM peptidoglycan-binding domain-containing protein [Bacillus xiapuensis]
MHALLKEYSFVLLFTAVAFIAGVVLILSLSAEKGPFQEIVVQEGDSLWSIADQYEQTNGMNKEEFIMWVQKENQLLSARIQPGDVLVIPVNSAHSSGDQQVVLKEE